MKTIGWLADEPGYKGGAEYDMEELLRHAPDWAELVLCGPDKVELGLDAYIVNNCAQFTDKLIPVLEGHTVIKRMYDIWPAGSARLRAWLLNKADLTICLSPLQVQAIRWHIGTKVTMVPSTVNLTPFQDAAGSKNRAGAVWLGRIVQGKGIEAAWQWAVEHDTTIDVYGRGTNIGDIKPPMRYLGELDADDVPYILSKYETFVFLPDGVDCCPRTVTEAWAAGCKLVVNGNAGSIWWIQNHPEALSKSAEMFWAAVEGAVL